MSKRFGRNQRRHMREQINALRVSVTIGRVSSQHLRESINKLRSEIEEAKRMLPFHSVLFDAGVVSLSARTMETINLVNTPLPVLLSKIVPDGLNGAVHTHVRFGDGRWGYAVSRDALKLMPHDLLVRRISEGLALLISKDLKEHYK